MTDINFAAHAIVTALTGKPVFPCRSNAKEPLTAHGFQEASLDLDVIKGWWSRWPTANIAMPTGAATADVLDVDNHGSDANGFAALRRIRDHGLANGAHRLVRTPRGGLHLYFRPSGNRNGSMLKHHIDSRGDGGYVLIPPSIVNGNPYQLLEDRPAAVGTLDWPRIRELLSPTPRSAFTCAPPESAGVGALVGWLGNVTEGGRNNALFWACCRAAENGHPVGELVRVAVGLGLSEQEAERTARSALKRVGVAA